MMKNIKTFALSCALLTTLFSFQSANAVEVLLSGVDESANKRVLQSQNGQIVKEHGYDNDLFFIDTDTLLAGLYNIKSIAEWDNNSERLTGRLLVSQELPNGYLMIKISEYGFAEINTFGDEQTRFAVTTNRSLPNVHYKQSDGENLTLALEHSSSFLVVLTANNAEPFFIPLFEGERIITAEEKIDEIIGLVINSLRSELPQKAAHLLKEFIGNNDDSSLIGQVFQLITQNVPPLALGAMMIELSKPTAIPNQVAFENAPALLPPPPPAPVLRENVQAAPKQVVNRFNPQAQQQVAHAACADELAIRLARVKNANFEVAEHPAVRAENEKIQALVQEYRAQFNADRSTKDLLKLNVNQEKTRLETFRDTNKENYNRCIRLDPTNPLIGQIKETNIRIKALARMLAS